jgi:diaminopimelate epimerase
MTKTFYKYQGTGNDFVVFDNRQMHFDKNNASFINRLCDRKLGIGADGLLLLENSATTDFTMVYFNADGTLGSMCGNGGRCIVAFASFLGIIDTDTQFEAYDGLHKATINNGIVSLQMKNVKDIDIYKDHIFLDTGSPHHVQCVENVSDFDVDQVGRKIRYAAPYFEAGANVNFVQVVSEDAFKVRTYERGVEAETLSCGTGVTAVAIAMHATNQTSQNEISLHTEGGVLQVRFNNQGTVYSDVFLVGPAVQVFSGTINVGFNV